MIKSNKFSVKSFGKAVLLLLSMWVLIFILPGCTDKSASAKDEKTILVSGFAQYDWLLKTTLRRLLSGGLMKAEPICTAISPL